MSQHNNKPKDNSKPNKSGGDRIQVTPTPVVDLDPKPDPSPDKPKTTPSSPAGRTVLNIARTVKGLKIRKGNIMEQDESGNRNIRGPRKYEKDEGPNIWKIHDQMNALHARMGGRDGRPERRALERAMDILRTHLDTMSRKWIDGKMDGQHKTKKFKDFIAEMLEDQTIDTDVCVLGKNVDEINSTLDKLTEKPYQNAPLFLLQLRGCFERFGIVLPAEATPNFMNQSAEMVYSFGDDTPHSLYIIYDTNDDGFVDGYAQIVTPEELNDLKSADMDDVLNSDRDPIRNRPSDWYRKRDDDAGNSGEYA